MSVEGRTRAVALVLVAALLIGLGFAAGRATKPALQRKGPGKAAQSFPKLAAKEPAAELALARKEALRPPASSASGGRFRSARIDDRSKVQVTEAQAEAMRAIGYESGTIEAPSKVGVTVYDRQRALAGVNLQTDGHSPSAILMDMEGRTLHSWQLDYKEAFPNEEFHAALEQSLTFWRRAIPLKNGGLLAIYEGVKLVRLDRNSKVLWSVPYAHHDADVTVDGTIYVLTRKWEKHPKKKTGRATDYITVVGGDGEVRKEVSILDAIVKSPFVTLLDHTEDGFETFHTNTIEGVGRNSCRQVARLQDGKCVDLLAQAGRDRGCGHGENGKSSGRCEACGESNISRP